MVYVECILFLIIYPPPYIYYDTLTGKNVAFFHKYYIIELSKDTGPA